MSSDKMPRRKPPFECIVGDYQFEKLRIPDEFSINLSEKNGDPSKVVFTLTERYIESREDFVKRERQIEDDKKGILSDAGQVSVEYDEERYRSVVSITREGDRAEMILGILKEIILQSKFFAGEEESEWVFQNLQVRGDGE
ncbi:hypothetical protein [Caldiplasma sukawensis]